MSVDPNQRPAFEQGENFGNGNGSGSRGIRSRSDDNEAFQNHCTQKTLSDICAVFVKHKAQHIYGPALVHQHFDLETDEKLVNIGNVAVPLKTGSVSTTIAATRWAFSGESVIPYEFSTEARQIDMNQHHDFIYELGKLIHSCGLSDNLGLCSLDSIADTTKGPTMEFTSGRANITLPFDIDPENGQNVEAAWQVHEGIAAFICGRLSSTHCTIGSILGMVGFAQCKSRCKRGPNTGHQSHHKYTRA